MLPSSTITRAMTQDGSARLIVSDSTVLVQRGHEIHQTSKTMTAAFGRALTVASLMGCLLKNKTDSLTLVFDGDGPAGKISVTSDDLGNVRGYAEHPEAELHPNSKGKLDVGGAVGQGTLTVIRDLSEGEPYTGTIDLVSGEIAEDITNYFAVSEQTPTVCALGVLADRDCSCIAAGGYLLQLLPGFDPDLIPKLEANVVKLPPVSSLIRDGIRGEELIARILDGIPFDLFDEIPTGYVCPCNRDRYARALMTLGVDELSSLIAEGEPVETRCRYCRATHTFSVQDIHDMITAISRQ